MYLLHQKPTFAKMAIMPFFGKVMKNNPVKFRFATRFQLGRTKRLRPKRPRSRWNQLVPIIV